MCKVEFSSDALKLKKRSLTSIAQFIDSRNLKPPKLEAIDLKDLWQL